MSSPGPPPLGQSRARPRARGPCGPCVWCGVAVPLLLAACGHPASQQECEEIFRRSAELELRSQNISDPDEIERRVQEARAARGDELMRECVGKRITDDAMACVRSAPSPEELDRCLK